MPHARSRPSRRSRGHRARRTAADPDPAWDGSEAGPPVGPVLGAEFPGGRCAAWSGRRANSASPRRTSPVTWTWTVTSAEGSVAGVGGSRPGRRGPAVGAAARPAPLAASAARLGALGRGRPPGCRSRVVRYPAQPGPGPGGHRPPLRPVQRVLRTAARRVHGVLVRLLHHRPDRVAGRRATRQARPDLPQARPGRGQATARHRLWLGFADLSCRQGVRRRGGRGDAVRAAIPLCQQAGGGRGAVRPGAGAARGLPRAGLRRRRRRVRCGRHRSRWANTSARTSTRRSCRSCAGCCGPAVGRWSNRCPGRAPRPAAERSSRPTSRRTCT